MFKVAKITSYAVSVILSVTLLSSCAAEQHATYDRRGLLSSDKLTVGVHPGYPPFEYYDDDTKALVGFDIDLANAVAEYLDVEITFVDTAWDSIFHMLEFNEYDCVISAVTISPEREKIMDFSLPYADIQHSVVVRKGGGRLSSLAELSGLTVGCQNNTISEEYLTALIDEGAVSCAVNSYGKITECFDALRFGEIDALICDSIVADVYINREPGVFATGWLQSDEPSAKRDSLAIAVKLGNQKLRGELTRALESIRRSGKLDEISSKWLSPR